MTPHRPFDFKNTEHDDPLESISNCASGLVLTICAVVALAVMLIGHSIRLQDDERLPYLANTEQTQPHSAQTPTSVRLGLIELDRSRGSSREIDASIEAVRQAVAPRPLKVVRHKAEELDRLVKAGEIDFFVASSGFYWRMVPYGAINLATQTSAFKPDPNHASALAFVVKAESPFRTLADLKGKRLVASYPTAFMGYRIGMAEIARQGHDWEHFFYSTLYSGSPQVPSVLAILDQGQADIAFITSCALEEMPPQIRNRYRVINPQVHPSLSCAASTASYPGHSFSVMNSVDPELAKSVLSALLSLKGNNNSESWSVATDFTEVDRMYRHLRIGPYQHLRETRFSRWVHQYRYLILLTILAIAGLAAHNIRASILVRRRTQEMLESAREKELVQAQLAATNERMEKLGKAGVVAQLSSMVSHELSQPLAAIRCYVEGNKEMLDSGQADLSLIRSSNEKISQQTNRAIAIVEKVRSYAKSEVQRETCVPLLPLIDRALASRDLSQVKITKLFESAPQVRGDELELELLFWNLLKNALEAALCAPSPAISITVSSSESLARIEVENSGTTLSEEDITRLHTPLNSQKSGGLGLGLSIIHSIAEASGGGIEYCRRPQGGVIARIRLPLWKAELRVPQP